MGADGKYISFKITVRMLYIDLSSAGHGGSEFDSNSFRINSFKADLSASRLLSSEGFNHSLIENQLLKLQQDINMDSKAGGRKIYKVRRDNGDPNVSRFS